MLTIIFKKIYTFCIYGMYEILNIDHLILKTIKIYIPVKKI